MAAERSARRAARYPPGSWPLRGKRLCRRRRQAALQRITTASVATRTAAAESARPDGRELDLWQPARTDLFRHRSGTSQWHASFGARSPISGVGDRRLRALHERTVAMDVAPGRSDHMPVQEAGTGQEKEHPATRIHRAIREGGSHDHFAALPASPATRQTAESGRTGRSRIEGLWCAHLLGHAASCLCWCWPRWLTVWPTSLAQRSVPPIPSRRRLSSDRFAPRAGRCAMGVTVAAVFVMMVCSFSPGHHWTALNRRTASPSMSIGHQWWWEVHYPNRTQPDTIVDHG